MFCTLAARNSCQRPRVNSRREVVTIQNFLWELGFHRMDLRFDSIEDKVERHLGWHRAEAEGDLTEALSKEISTRDHRINPYPHPSASNGLSND